MDAAVAIVATHASGRVLGFDGAVALAMLGVRLLMTHENAPKLKAVMATKTIEG